MRRTAMGSIIGRPDDASAIYHNPAGLVLQHGWNLYASFGLSLLVGSERSLPTGAAFHADAVTRYHLIDAYVVAPQAVIAGAYRINDAISVGASVGAINIRVHEQRDLFPIFEVNGMPTDVSAIAGNTAAARSAR